MDAARSALPRLIDSLAPTLGDHTRSLAELHAYLEPQRPALIEAWRLQLESENAAPSLPRLVAPDNLERAAQVLFDGWRGLPALTSRAYLASLAEWSLTVSARGYTFIDLHQLLADFRRALLPYMLQHYAAGPALQLVFSALDAWERAALGVIAAACAESAQAQLEQTAHQQTVGRLTGGMGHSLNNMLAVILGRAQLMEDETHDTLVLEQVHAIQNTARAGADSLRRLQQYAMVRDTGSPARIDVNLIVSEVVALTRFRWRDDAEASGITIDVVKDLSPVPPVMGHSAMVRDALVELILNSVEAMPLGGLVTIRSERIGDQVRISVVDLGEGMDQNTQAHAGEPFFTTKGAGHPGLGLARVSAMALAHGGDFAVESRRGQGTTATIVLPIAPKADEALEPRQSRLARWANVLVVDDEPMVREVAWKTFKARGFNVSQAESGADALRLIQEDGPFEIVLTDLGMPGMTGFELAQEIKKTNPRTVVILMTGWAAELDPKKIRESGIDRAITKPFDIDQVVQLVTEAIAIREKM